MPIPQSNDPNCWHKRILLREKEQLLDHWMRLFGQERGKLNLSSKPIARLLGPTRGSRDDVRKFHDVFGWCAKRPVKCAGAIYRTKAFMELSPDERDASKPRHLPKCQWPRNIHIEHTVLVSQLHHMWLARPVDAPVSPVFFLANGITTAMHVEEERALGNDYRTPNACFDDGEGLPFGRYAVSLSETSSIWNVFTGQLINMKKFTLADHRATVSDLLEMVKAPDTWIEDILALQADYRTIRG